MLDKLHNFFCNKRVLLLGCGLEGQSTLRLLERLDCAQSVEIWKEYHHTTKIPDEYDVIMKSPGIPLFEQFDKKDPRITGQTDLFLRFCRDCNTTVIGITGTKGKSTTSSLINHILSNCGINNLLIGNIGVPAFDVIDKLSDNIIVFELSCHQLEYVQASPQIAVFLNLFEDHLDHYIDFAHYRAAKENIFRFQSGTDLLIRGEDVDSSIIDPNKARLRGVHNIHNIAVAVRAATVVGAQQSAAISAGCTFGGLEHRLELFIQTDSMNNGDSIKWVNDSISTIPEAAIAAIEAFPETDTLIIGGLDRGIDYSILIEFLQKSTLNIIALPDSGHKIVENLYPFAETCSGLPSIKIYKAADLADAVAHAKKVTKRCCVLSPAAASYGVYKNFEERGREFKRLVTQDL
jgi:UDP-N-acetylmuramoylalanine--D-glutamate ligase